MSLTARQQALVDQGRAALTVEVLDAFIADEAMRTLLQHACRERLYVGHVPIHTRYSLHDTEGNYIDDIAAAELDRALSHFGLELTVGSGFHGDAMYGDQL